MANKHFPEWKDDPSYQYNPVGRYQDIFGADLRTPLNKI